MIPDIDRAGGKGCRVSWLCAESNAVPLLSWRPLSTHRAGKIWKALRSKQQESRATYLFSLIKSHFGGFGNGSGMRWGRRSLAHSANPHLRTARRMALLVMTSPGPGQGYLQFHGSWVVAATPCSNFTLWSLRKRKEAGKTPNLWHISELAWWLQLFVISVGGGCRYPLP